MKNYLALCEILHYWIMGKDGDKDGDKNLMFRIGHHKKNKIELSFLYEVGELLDIDEHFSKQAKNHVEFTKQGYAFDVNDSFAVKYVLYALAEKYILWEHGGEDLDGNKIKNWEDKNYKEDLKDPSATMTYDCIKMINRKFKCKMSWSDFQKQKMLDSFVNN